MQMLYFTFARIRSPRRYEKAVEVEVDLEKPELFFA